MLIMYANIVILAVRKDNALLDKIKIHAPNATLNSSLILIRLAYLKSKR